MHNCKTWWARHSWGKWAVEFTGDMNEVFLPERKTGKILIQKRVCEKCGLTERRQDKLHYDL